MSRHTVLLLLSERPMQACQEAMRGLAFGRFRILPQQGQLLAGDEPVEIGARAFELLLALAEADGAVILKDELIGRIWQNRVVCENILHVQVKALRKALGPDRDLIRTVPGRGYQLVAQAFPLGAAGLRADRPSASAARPARALCNLPQPISELIGREAELAEVVGRVRTHRLVTVTGAGGIGKTRIACEAALQLLPEFPDGVRFVELSSVAEPDLVAAAVASAAGLELAPGETSVARVAAALATRGLLLVLDTCEHVIEAAATLAEALLRIGASARVLATSREPLLADGEWVYRLRPLALPVEGETAGGCNDAAVSLFIARARANNADLPSDCGEAAVIAAICRQLDGIPLAIELAAARAATLGIHTLAARLDDQLQLLNCGRRTALPRHQTLRGLLDWSYELLTAGERTVLRRLSVIRGTFGLDAAKAVAAGEDISPASAVAGLANLVAKSLVSAELNGAAGSYRLLEATRAYAFEKLSKSGEREAAARHYREFCRDGSAHPQSEWDVRPVQPSFRRADADGAASPHRTCPVLAVRPGAD
jgi:predicted ATPase/DNA-binding winged helix-turn-helix (wHTH) protein